MGGEEEQQHVFKMITVLFSNFSSETQIICCSTLVSRGLLFTIVAFLGQQIRFLRSVGIFCLKSLFDLQAIEVLERATRVKPVAPLFILLGKTNMKAKRFENAISSFERAIQLMVFHSSSSLHPSRLYSFSEASDEHLS